MKTARESRLFQARTREIPEILLSLLQYGVRGERIARVVTDN